MNYNEIQKRIIEIGESLFQCDFLCTDVRVNISEGIPPRCLVLQDWAGVDTNAEGCAVIGINPGPIINNEHVFYKTQGTYYQTLWCYFKKQTEHGFMKGYYKDVYTVIKNMGIRGPILWTELAHCECFSGYKLSLETKTRCSRKYLYREMEAIPESWPLIGVGNDAFNILIARYPSRFVIGIPHPRARKRQLGKLIDVQKQQSDDYNINKLKTVSKNSGFIKLPF